MMQREKRQMDDICRFLRFYNNYDKSGDLTLFS